jgi:hypothetical protein
LHINGKYQGTTPLLYELLQLFALRIAFRKWELNQTYFHTQHKTFKMRMLQN